MIEEETKIKTDSIKDHFMDIGKRSLCIELPCGYIDDENKLHDTLIVKQLMGRDEDLLLGSGPIVPRLNQIIANCTTQLGSISDKGQITKAVFEMTAADRFAALIAIRRISLGDLYFVVLGCPSCKSEHRRKIDLKDIEIVKMQDQMVRERTDTLSSGRTVCWHVMSREDEEWLSDRRRKDKENEDVLSIAMMSRISAIDINEDGKVASHDVDRKSKNGYKRALSIFKDELSMVERREIRKLFSSYDGTVNSEIDDVVCPSCGHEWSFDVTIGGKDFFFPSGK